MTYPTVYLYQLNEERDQMYSSNGVLLFQCYHKQSDVCKQFPSAKVVKPPTTTQVVQDSDTDAGFFRKLEAMGIQLNQQQVEIIRDKSSKLLVQALPGTGKTMALVSLAAYFVAVESARCQDILLITHSKKAAREIKSRLDGIIPDNTINCFTIHSLCYKIINARGFRKYRIISTDRELQGMMKAAIHEQGFDEEYQPEELLKLYSYHCNRMSLPYDKGLTEVFTKFGEKKEEHISMDFDDLLTKAMHLLTRNPLLKQILQKQFRYILVDEVQDVSLLQYEILKQLCNTDTVMYCFGDINQSIYSFRGAEANIFRHFQKEFLGIRTRTLDVNYRSHNMIAGLANLIISPNNQNAVLRSTGQSIILPQLLRPYDSISEAKFIVNAIVSAVKRGTNAYSNYAVLYRSSNSARLVIEELINQDIPFVSNDPPKTIYDEGPVKIIFAHLKQAINPMDIESLKEILPTLYLQWHKVRRLLQEVTIIKGVLELLSELPGLQEYQYRLINERVELVHSLKNLSPLQAIEAIEKDKCIRCYLKIPDIPLSFQDDALNELLIQLKDASKEYGTIQQFLEHIADITDKSNRVSNSRTSSVDAVTLSSIHAAKGLEYGCVFLLNVTDGSLPHKYTLESNIQVQPGDINFNPGSIEEERRLLYVATTRAREELYITAPQFSNGFSCEISRFLKPLSEYFKVI